MSGWKLGGDVIDELYKSLEVRIQILIQTIHSLIKDYIIFYYEKHLITFGYFGLISNTTFINFHPYYENVR